MAKSMNIIGCGGSGSKILHYICSEKNTNKHLASINPIYCDTSTSDIWELSFSDNAVFHRLEGADGSGSDPSKNYQRIAAHAIQIVAEMEHTDVTVLIGSAAGGSGNMYMTSMAREIAKMGKSVLCVYATSDSNKQWTRNSLNVFKSFGGICKVINGPLVTCRIPNGPESSQNKHFAEIVNGVRLLAGGDIPRLDTADVKNFFCLKNFNNSAPAEPVHLSIMDIYPDKQGNYDKATLADEMPNKIFSSIELIDNADTDLGIKSIYGCRGINPDQDSKHCKVYTLNFNANEAIQAELTDSLEKYKKYEQSLTTAHSVVSGTAITDDGMVFDD